MSAPCAVILGGYGNFGVRVAAALASDRAYRVLVAGRDMEKATRIARRLDGSAEPLAIDCQAPDFAARLQRVGATVVVHTAGPFQAQGYSVPRACIEAGAHYVDIADGRAYVCGIGELDAAAKQRDVLVASGASSLPALSSAVVDELQPQFSRIDSIEHGITSGARPPGIATLEGVMSYVGRPFTRWQDGAWKFAYGWQDIVARRYPAPLGVRWIANCDVPDLELFHERYPTARSVVFRAGIGFASSTLAVWLASWLVRARLMKTLAAHAPLLHRMALAIEPYGSKWSAMHVTVGGLDQASRPTTRTWHLLAGSDHGPNIPCFPAIALARKLLRGEVRTRGALPCMGMLGSAEILGAIPGLDLQVIPPPS